ncbi:MAG TPA: carboxymuconolactone decarboxylase family protein [Sphingobium sp.]|uniref:carboxymuconolactone decarboxylase family protein n=1 Tax=Sphingobium sp. TaxID=1912891 RepID=UPI002ED360CD
MATSADTRPYDIEAREADILGKPQRVESLREEEFSPEARALVRDIHGTLGVESTSVPDVFGVMLRHPRLFKCQMDAGIVFFQGEISPRERELAVLRVAWWCKAPYEWGEHVDISKRYGVTDEEVERMTQGSDAPGWSEHDRAIIRGVEELLGEQMISDATWDVLARTWTEAQLVEFPALVGAYFATALQQNSLRVRLAPDNPGLSYR